MTKDELIYLPGCQKVQVFAGVCGGGGGAGGGIVVWNIVCICLMHTVPR